MLNNRTRWAIALGLSIALVTSTMVISNNVPVAVKDANGVTQNFATIQNATNQLIAENGICDGQAAAACATVKGSSSAAAATDSAMVVALTPNSPAVTSAQAASLVPMPIYAGTLTVSATAGSNFVAPVAVAGTVSTSPVAGSNLFITSAQVGSLQSPPIAIGSAPTINISPVSGGNLYVTSAAASSLVTAVNCINGCAGAGTTVVSPASTTLVQTGYPADAACGTDTGTCSEIALIKRLNTIVDGAIPAGTNLIGSVNVAAATTGGCTSQYITASTSNIFTQIKASAGTLCWLRIINASAISATVRLYDTATNGNLVCSGSTLPVSYDVVQPNTTSPGLVGNLGPFGAAFATGIGLCITGITGTTFNFQDTTSLTTNAIFVNIGTK